MNSNIKNLNFNYLPKFAEYLLNEKLEVCSGYQLDLARKYAIPLVAHLQNLSETEISQLSKVTIYDFLYHLAEEKAAGYLQKQIQTWINDKLPQITRNEIVADDIMLMNFIRKRILLKLIPDYTQQLDLALKLIEEIDIYYLNSESDSVSVYIKILEQLKEDNIGFATKITDKIPALIYVYDTTENTTIFTNRRYDEILGPSIMGQGKSLNETFKTRIHPSDIEVLEKHINTDYSTFTDDTTWPIEFRMLDQKGEYRWYRTYESIFKRKDDGTVLQIIGVSFDVQVEKLIGEELRHRENQLLEAQELAQIGSFEWNVNTDKLVATPELVKILGESGKLDFTTFIGKIHTSDRNRVQKVLNDAIISSGEYEIEFRYTTDQNEKVIWSRGIVTYNEGSAELLKGTVMDITKRHHMVKMLQRSEDLYKQAQALTNMGNWTWNLQTGKISWTDQLYRIFWMQPQERVITHSLIETYVHPEDREARSRTVAESIQKLKPYDFYYRINSPDGKQKILQARGEVLLDEAGVPYKMLGTIQDVTAAKKIEYKLLENQTFIQKIADATPSVITSFNIHTGKFTFVSMGLKKILGYEPSTLLHDGVDFLQEIIHPENFQEVMENNRKALETANKTKDNTIILEFIFRARHQNGRYRWIHTYGTIFDRNKAGRVEQVLNSSLDITDRIEAEQKIAQKTLELQQSNKSLEEFAHVASHDLKEPLRKISTFGDRLYMLESESISEEGKVYLQKIIDSSKRMQQLIDDLLSVSTISSEKTFERYSLKSILEEVVNSLEHKIEEKQARITIDTYHEIRIVPSQFRQLFQNLLSNSLKFIRPDTIPEIHIRSMLVRPWQINTKNLKPANLYLQIIVSDNGIGFKEQFSEHIFSIFQRLHPKSQYEGTGIGLAICKKIVENHGGIIYASSKENEGSLFTIILPL